MTVGTVAVGTSLCITSCRRTRRMAIGKLLSFASCGINTLCAPVTQIVGLARSTRHEVCIGKYISIIYIVTLFIHNSWLVWTPPRSTQSGSLIAVSHTQYSPLIRNSKVQLAHKCVYERFRLGPINIPCTFVDYLFRVSK